MPSKSSKLINAASRGDFRNVAKVLKERALGKPWGVDGREAMLSALANLKFRTTKVVNRRVVSCPSVPTEDVKKVIKLLLQAGIDPDFVLHDMTPLSSAASAGILPLVRMLVDAGADPNPPNACLCPPLTNALLSGHKPVVEFLLRHGADTRSKDVEGKTALDWATFVLQRGAKYQPLYNMVKAVHAKASKNTMIKTKSRKNTARPAIKDFLSFIWDWGHPEWVILAVESPLEQVSHQYSKLTATKRSWSNVAVRPPDKKHDEMASLVALVQPKDSTWTVIYSTMCCPIGSEEFEDGQRIAQAFSAKLKTRTLVFIGEDTSGAMDLSLYKNGKRTGGKEWESQNDSADDAFVELGLSVPVCYPNRKGKAVWLTAPTPWAEQILRADVIEVEDFD